MEPAQVLVVEDDDMVRRRICAAIDDRDELQVMAEAHSLHSARTILGKRLPSLALVDLGLPDGTGTNLINWLSSQHSIPCLVLTVFGDELHVVSAIQAGAVGYLLKCEDRNQVGSNLVSVLNGDSPISAAVARHILKEVCKSKDEPEKSNQTDDQSAPRLTPAELEVLQLIAKGYTSPEIAVLTSRAPSTVLVHVRNVYRKLSVHSRGEAVFEAINLGLVLTH